MQEATNINGEGIMDAAEYRRYDITKMCETIMVSSVDIHLRT